MLKLALAATLWLIATSAVAQKAPNPSGTNAEGYPTYSPALDNKSLKTWIDGHLEGWGYLFWWDDHFAAFILPDMLDTSHPPIVKATVRMETTSQPTAELANSRSSVMFLEVNCSEHTSRTTQYVLYPGNNLQGEPHAEQNPSPQWEPFSDPNHSLMGGAEASLCR
jgi:hypothetical protein